MFEALVPFPAVMTGKSGEVADASVDADDTSAEVVDASMKVVDASIEDEDSASVDEEEEASVDDEDDASVDEEDAASIELEEASDELEEASVELEDTSVEVKDAVSAACLLCRASRGTISAIVLIAGTGVTTTVRTDGAVTQTGVVKSGTGPPGQEV